MKYNIVIFYEHKVRELPAVRKLRAALESRNNFVAIFSIAFEWYDAYQFAKRKGIDALIIPWCYQSEQFWRFSPFIEINKNVKLINLHHEQITPKLTQSVLLPRDQIARDYPYHICWTEFFKHKLIEIGTAEDRCFTLGNIRLEAPHKNCETRNRLSIKYNLDSSKQWILYSESRRIDEVSLLKIEQDFHDNAHLSKKDCDLYFDRWKESLNITIEQIQQLPESFYDNYELIYRPHPGSTIEFDLGGRSHIISSGPISDWLSAIDVFCTWQSTSSFEAEMYNIPVLFHRSVPIPEIEEMPGVSDYLAIENIADICENITNRALKQQREAPIYAKYVGEYRTRTPDIYANAIMQIMKRDDQLDSVPYSKTWLGKMFLSELVIKVMRPTGLIRKLHWPHTASMMFDDIPFGDKSCSDLH